MSKTLKGVFPALPTPFREDLSVDYAALKRVVEFAISAGAHGLLAVDMPGEFFTLTDDERRNCVEVILETVADRVPVAVNVSAASEEQSFLFAKHAVHMGAAAIVTTPPFFRVRSPARIEKYFRQLNQVTDLPIIAQNSPENLGTAIDVVLQEKLVRENVNVQYLMEECSAAQLLISDVLHRVQGIPNFEAVAVGSCCQMMLHDYYRGVRLFVPQAEMTDLFVDLWDALESGDEQKAMDCYRIIAPVLMFGSAYQRSLSKEMLRRRGIIDTAAMRESSKPVFDEIQLQELDYWVEQLKPRFRV